MDHEELWKKCPLGLHFDGEEIALVREVLKEANTHYLLEIAETFHPENNSCTFEVVCPQSCFMNAAYYIGAQIGKKVLSKRKDEKQVRDFTAIISSCKFGQLSISEANKIINEQL